MKLKNLILLVLFAPLCGYSQTAGAGADEKPHWMLSETPAEVIITQPGDALSKPYNFQAICTIAVTENNSRVLVAWYASNQQPGVPLEGVNNHIAASIGTGDLKNFRHINLVIRSPHVGEVRCSDPFAWRDPSGRVWLAWTQSTGEYDYDGRPIPNRAGPWSRHGSTWAICTDNLEAPAPAWSAPRRLFDGMMINKPVYLKNGGALFASVQFNALEINDFHSMRDGVLVWRTDDDCATFTQIGYVRVADSPFIEPAIVEKNDGSIWMLMRRETGEKRLRFSGGKWVTSVTIGDGHYETFSRDGGRTFGRVRISPVPGIGSRTHVSRLASGSLLIVKSYTDDDLLWMQGKPKQDRSRGPYSRAAIVAFISRDDGKTWPGALFIDDRRADFAAGDRRAVSYPDAIQTADGSIYICWDLSRHSAPEIRAAKVTEADILAGKIITKTSIPRALVSKGPR